MKLHSIKTSNFRNLAGDELILSEGVNLLYGKNAAGKTNTLECVYVFASGKSFKARKESELIQKGFETARADIVLEKDQRKESMSVIWHNSKAKGFVKRLLYQNNELPKASEFLGIFRAVLFTPDHLSLIKGSPEERRRFMDIALSQMQPKYVYYLNSYLKVLSQKNAYLRNAAFSGKVDYSYIDILNEQLSDTASILIKQRYGFANMLKEHASEIYSKLTDLKESLDVKYISSTKRDFSDTEYTKAKLLEMYSQNKESELKQGNTLYGPHRDDFMMYISNNLSGDSENEVYTKSRSGDEKIIGEYAARTFGSQGQQRSAVLAVKLAEGEIIKSITGEYPVYLFDDLPGELDDDRRARLARMICDKQAIITCCDVKSMPKIENMSATLVENGRYIKG